MTERARLFWPVCLALLATDCTTKELAVTYLSPPHVPHPFIGDWVRLTLAYNSGAALGITLGGASRVGFSVLTLIGLAIMLRLYHRTGHGAHARIIALALLVAGAAGNLLDRLRSARGVVDFIDLGVGPVRFWTFNLADACITAGIALFTLVLARSRVAQDAAPAAGSGA